LLSKIVFVYQTCGRKYKKKLKANKKEKLFLRNDAAFANLVPMVIAVVITFALLFRHTDLKTRLSQ